MKMKPEEITAIIKKQIEDYNVEMNVDDVGTVLEVGDGIAHIYGLDKAMSGELLELPHGVYGMALNLEEDNVGAVLLGDDAFIKEGDTVRRTGRVMRVPVGEAMVGRVVTPHRSQGFRHRRPPAGQGTAPDGPQGYRLHGPYRPWPA